MADGASTAPYLAVENLEAWYGESHILHGVGFEIRAGEVVTLLGRNGAGKTTTLKAIMGIIGKRRGSVAYRGQETIGLSSRAIARLGIGYVPQGRQVFPSLTVMEHIEMVARPRREGWNAERVLDLFPRLAERRASHANLLSGGEQQMLAIARALLLNPALLLMDEPSEGLAPVIVDLLIDKFAELAKTGLRILLIEQNLELTTALAEDILLLDNGRVEARTTASTLKTDRKLLERFLGVSQRV